MALLRQCPFSKSRLSVCSDGIGAYCDRFQDVRTVDVLLVARRRQRHPRLRHKCCDLLPTLLRQIRWIKLGFLGNPDHLHAAMVGLSKALIERGPFHRTPILKRCSQMESIDAGNCISAEQSADRILPVSLAVQKLKTREPPIPPCPCLARHQDGSLALHFRQI